MSSVSAKYENIVTEIIFVLKYRKVLYVADNQTGTVDLPKQYVNVHNRLLAWESHLFCLTWADENTDVLVVTKPNKILTNIYYLLTENTDLWKCTKYYPYHDNVTRIS